MGTLHDRRTLLRDWMEARRGVVTSAELHALGFTKRAIDGMVGRGELIRVRRGVYRGRGTRWDHGAVLRAALSEQGEGARLMLVSSLHWQGLLYRPAPLPEIGVPGDGDVQRLVTRVVHRTPYARAGAVWHDGLPCAAPVDALLHLAGHIRGQHSTRRAFRRALRELVRRDARLGVDLRELVDRRPIPGTLELRAGLDSLPSATVVKSDLEEDFVAFCEIWGLPPFSMNRKVGGVERDAVRADERVIIELDTRGYHGNLIAMESDRRRRRRATVAGWRHLEITGHDLRDEPQRVASDLAALLGLRGWVPPADATVLWSAVILSARGIWLPRR
jgi:Transcriptional regulator, AbiEi antitoxin